MANPTGIPGVRSQRTATPRKIFASDDARFLPNSLLIDGSKSRDTGNTGDLEVLRAGLLMGKITSGGKYAPAIIGVTTGAVSATGTAVTVSAAQAVELVRRVGATGTIRLVGPPTANGTVATFTETYSAVNTSTGEITCSALNADLVAGSFVCADDGSYLPLTMQGKEDGVKVTDEDGVNVTSVPFEKFPIGGLLESANLIPWPSDTSLRAWIFANLNGNGQFSGNHLY